jgi:CRP-like cAMP-binding protein
MEFSTEHLLWAVALGSLSAISLPMGSLLGLKWQPSPRKTAALTAFGGGALIAALSVELVAPTALAIVGTVGQAREHALHHLEALIGGAVLGGILFVLLDELINAKGGFLRKTATTISHFTEAKAERQKEIIEHLAASALLRHLPPEAVEELVEDVKPLTLPAASTLFEEGDIGDRMYFIEKGTVEVAHGSEKIAELHPGDVIGEISLITGALRTASARSLEELELIALEKKDFDDLRGKFAGMEKAAQELASIRLEELVEKERKSGGEAELWAHDAMAMMPETAVVPTQAQLCQASEEHGGAPMAIWLGILLDGIPESFVIGATMTGAIAAHVATGSPEALGFTQIIPYTLIAGLFLSNFPEAMSSSIGMKRQGWSSTRVFMMWFALMVLTALGSGIGYALGGTASETLLAASEGIAAGAMLTMIASAMIPEAVHLGGSNITGLGTLSGFLAAVSFKVLE